MEKREFFADREEGVAVLFYDICGFTPLSVSLPPETLVTFLNRMFLAIDDLVEQHPPIVKIKTIGDVYV